MVGSWGTGYPVTDTVKYEMQTVCLVVFVPDQYAKMQVVSELNNFVLMFYKNGETLRFDFTAAALKEEKDPFTSADQFFANFKEWSTALESVKVNF